MNAGENIKTFHFDSLNKDSKQIIFIHGFASTSEYFHKFYKDQLQKYFSLDTIELPGMGLNVDSLDKYNIEKYAEYCVNYIEEKKWSNFILIGHSMGGAITEIICNKIPEKIINSILICPMNSSFSSKLFNFFKWKNKDNLEAYKYNIKFLFYDRSKVVPTDELLEKYFKNYNAYKDKNKKIITKVFESFLTFKTLKWLKAAEKENTVKTLVIFANNDQMIDAETGKKHLIHNINYTIDIINNSGHIPFIEQEEELGSTILNWLKVNK